MKILKFTLGRKIDINYPTNRLMLGISLFSAFAIYVLTKDIVQGLFCAAGFFFAWGITREIDPEKEYSAFLSAFIAIGLIFFYFYDGINLGPLFFILLALRFISGICGYEPTLIDILSLVLLGGYLSFTRENGVYFMILALMFFISWFRYDKGNVFLLLTAGAFALTILLFIIYPEVEFFQTFSSLSPVVIYGIRTLLIVLTIFQYYFLGKDQKIFDDLGKALGNQNIQKGLIFYSISVMLLFTLENLTQSTIIIMLSTLAGAALWRLTRPTGDASI